MFGIKELKKQVEKLELETKNREKSFAEEKRALQEKIECLQRKIENIERDLEDRRLLMWHMQFSYDNRISKLFLGNVEKEYEGNQLRLEELKDKHYGKRCFIIGNGPSLTPSDLDKIKNEISFGVNKIMEIYNYTDWRPTYYMASDPLLLARQNERMADAMASSEVLLDADFLEGIIPELRKEVIWYYHVNRYSIIPEFSNRPDKIVYEAGSVLFHAIQFAVFMGIKEIYLLGVDNSYQTKKMEDGREVLDFFAERPMHFYPSGDEEKEFHESMECWMDYNNLKKSGLYDSSDMWNAVKYHCGVNGVKVYNATRGGMLETFQRVELENVIR